MQLKAIIVSTLFLTSTAFVCGQEPQAKGDQAAQDVTKKEIEKPAPLYDEQADAREQIAAALMRAKKENRRVMILWGQNTRDWCRRLHTLFQQDKQIARKLMYEYDVVRVDIKEYRRNQDLAKHYGIELRTSGVPFFTVLDSEGAVLVNQETGTLEKKFNANTPADERKKGYIPDKVLDFLTKHQATYLKAEDILVQGVNQASSDGKRVFVHFGAPWCGWCKRLEAWMARDDVAKVLSKYFVDVKIDVDRTLGGKELYQRLSEGKGGGIPWSAVLNEQGDVVAGSFMKGDQNVGYPVTDEEIEAFLAMLATGMDRLSDKDRTFLASSLRKARPVRKH